MGNGSHNEQYRQDFMNAILDAVDEFPRTLALRVDLRFSKDYQYEKSNKEITRFIESLKAKLAVDCRKRSDRWNRTLRNRLRYIWVREVGELNRRKHYHVLLLLNKNIYKGPGNFDSDNSLAALIQQAWCSALSLDWEQHRYLVHFPEKACCYLHGNSANYMQEATDLMRNIDYMVKNYSKPYGDGYRSIGSSRR
ncbi:inovirus Gp2 family protein [Pantoea sp. CTOTU46764]|uniref:inovirus Gp2 family protein n=1 Tax=Pantoea sp. CTOTU46764 TaxID=2953854 RepID=UPI00289F93B0|nr:inovirus Gp2 family protein [Pantoea sp. CTOTU46764]